MSTNTTAEKTPRRVALLVATLISLYMSQGLVGGFTFSAAPTMLRAQGMPLQQVGLIALALLPWAFSFLVAPTIDRFKLPGRTHRRSWIIPMQVILPFVFLLLAYKFSASGFYTIMALIFAVGMIAAVSDVAVHGLAVEQLKPSQRGWGNGLQVGGYWVGSLFGAGTVLMLQPELGTFNTIALVAIAFFPLLIPVLFYPEEVTRPRAALQRHRPSFRYFLRRREAWLMLLLILLYFLGRAAASSMQGPFLVDSGFSLADIGLLKGSIGVAAGLAGSVAASYFAGKMSRDRALVLAATLQALAFGAYAAMVWLQYLPHWLLGAVFALEFFAFSAAIVVVYAFIMDNCSTEQAGTDFTLQYCFGNLVVILGGGISGFGVAAYGYTVHFAICFAVCALAAILTPLLYRQITRGTPPTAAEAELSAAKL